MEVVLDGPPRGDTSPQKPGMFARAVVPEPSRLSSPIPQRHPGGRRIEWPVRRALQGVLTEPGVFEDRTDQGDVNRETPVRGARHRQLEPAEIGSRLLADERLEGLCRRSEEERSIDVPKPGHQACVWSDDCDGSLMCGLDEARSDLGGDEIQVTGASSCWLR